MKRKYDAAAAGAASATIPPEDDGRAAPPLVQFAVNRCNPSWMFAEPPGARIACHLAKTGVSDVAVCTRDGEHIALIEVRRPEDSATDITTETIAIASAIYWSWWRAERMHGRTHQAP